MNAIVITENSNDVDIGPNNYVQNSVVEKVLFDKKGLSSFSKDFSHKTSVIATCYTLAKVEIRTSIQNRFKNQAIDGFKLLGHDYCNHPQGFAKQKIFTLH